MAPKELMYDLGWRRYLNSVLLKTIKFVLTFEAPITTAADDIHKYLIQCFSEKIRLDVSSESSARQRIHMKN